MPGGVGATNEEVGDDGTVYGALNLGVRGDTLFGRRPRRRTIDLFVSLRRPRDTLPWQQAEEESLRWATQTDEHTGRPKAFHLTIQQRSMRGNQMSKGNRSSLLNRFRCPFVVLGALTAVSTFAQTEMVQEMSRRQLTGPYMLKFKCEFRDVRTSRQLDVDLRDLERALRGEGRSPAEVAAELQRWRAERADRPRVETFDLEIGSDGKSFVVAYEKPVSGSVFEPSTPTREVAIFDAEKGLSYQHLLGAVIIKKGRVLRLGRPLPLPGLGLLGEPLLRSAEAESYPKEVRSVLSISTGAVCAVPWPKFGDSGLFQYYPGICFGERTDDGWRVRRMLSVDPKRPHTEWTFGNQALVEGTPLAKRVVLTNYFTKDGVATKDVRSVATFDLVSFSRESPPAVRFDVRSYVNAPAEVDDYRTDQLVRYFYRPELPSFDAMRDAAKGGRQTNRSASPWAIGAVAATAGLFVTGCAILKSWTSGAGNGPAGHGGVRRGGRIRWRRDQAGGRRGSDREEARDRFLRRVMV